MREFVSSSVRLAMSVSQGSSKDARSRSRLTRREIQFRRRVLARCRRGFAQMFSRQAAAVAAQAAFHAMVWASKAQDALGSARQDVGDG